MKTIRRKPKEIPVEEWRDGPPPAAKDRPLCVQCGQRLQVVSFGTELIEEDDGTIRQPTGGDQPHWFWQGYEFDEHGLPLFCALRCAARYAGDVIRLGIAGSRHLKTNRPKRGKKV